MRILLILVSTVPMVGGCATIATGGGHTQTVRFNSEPEGADVFVDGRPVGQTPTAAELTRKDDHAVRLEMTGYPEHVVILKHQPNPWTPVNFISAGPLGFAVDASSGAAEGTLAPGDVMVVMQPVQPAGSTEGPPELEQRTHNLEPGRPDSIDR